MSDIKLITIKLSPAQFNALYMLEEATGENKSDLVRGGLADECARYSIDFPQDVARRGQYERPQLEINGRQYDRNLYKRAKTRVTTQNVQAMQRSLPCTLTIEQWQYALDYFNGCCAVCGKQLADLFETHKESIDHWIPLNYKGDDNPGTVATNIVPLCYGMGGCNNSKHDYMPDEWLKRQYGKQKAQLVIARVQAYFDSLIN